jgi:uroporphyrinogen-III synthase
MRVLVTRPMPDCERTAATLRGRGYDVLVVPLMQVKPIAADLSGNWSAVIISSANAVRALDAQQIASLAKLPLFAVGQRSADAARDAGFMDVRSANGNAEDLIRLVAGSNLDQAATYLYLAGEDRAADVEGELAKRGIEARTVIVYKSVTLDYPPELANALRNREIAVALHFSRRSAENYVNGAKAAGLEQMASAPQHFCLSAQVTEPLRAAGVVGQISVAPDPNEAALLAILPPPP